jgi:F0F1-type ATP synthase assembly protein I
VQFVYRNEIEWGYPREKRLAREVPQITGEEQFAMKGLALDKYSLQKVAGLVAGIPIGVVLGPLVFTPMGVPIAAAAPFGCVVGAVVGFSLASLLVYRQKANIDREIERAAIAVRKEAGLPDTIRINIKDAYVVLEGSVTYEAQRSEAERVIATIPGIRGVINRIRFVPPAAA